MFLLHFKSKKLILRQGQFIRSEKHHMMQNKQLICTLTLVNYCVLVQLSPRRSLFLLKRSENKITGGVYDETLQRKHQRHFQINLFSQFTKAF